MEALVSQRFGQEAADRYRMRSKNSGSEHQQATPNLSAPQPVPESTSSLDKGKRTLQVSPFLASLSTRVHASHPLGHKRGVVWCWKCGSFAANAILKLALECPGGADRYGLDCLSRLRRGLTPRSDRKWPDGRGQDDTPPDMAFISAAAAPFPNNAFQKKGVNLPSSGRLWRRVKRAVPR